jgi:hypothetical protein
VVGSLVRRSTTTSIVERPYFEWADENQQCLPLGWQAGGAALGGEDFPDNWKATFRRIIVGDDRRTSTALPGRKNRRTVKK